MKKYDEFKDDLNTTEAYKLAGQVQENFALSFPGSQLEVKQYEGHLSVIDILNKIDSMIRMFEKTIAANPTDKSAQKIVSVVESLYELGQVKMTEAKKQCSSYMKKASGVTSKRISLPNVVEPELDHDPSDTDFSSPSESGDSRFKKYIPTPSDSSLPGDANSEKT